MHLAQSVNLNLWFLTVSHSQLIQLQFKKTSHLAVDVHFWFCILLSLWNILLIVYYYQLRNCPLSSKQFASFMFQMVIPSSRLPFLFCCFPHISTTLNIECPKTSLLPTHFPTFCPKVPLLNGFSLIHTFPAGTQSASVWFQICFGLTSFMCKLRIS